MRKTNFANGEYYHIFNRGVDKRKVFLDSEDFERFLRSLIEFNRLDAIGSLYEQWYLGKKGKETMVLGAKLPKIVEIVCYCLNLNHFHLILKQTSNKGVERFMHKVSTGYTNYFNQKYDRSGSLFQGSYKSIHISSNEYLLYMSAYVNCNSEVHKLTQADTYRWCSFSEYLEKDKNGLCSKDIILRQFRTRQEYYSFAKASAQEIRDKRDMDKLALE